jgi:hypothetical protein
MRLPSGSEAEQQECELTAKIILQNQKQAHKFLSG